MFTKILLANRGEIAIRIIRACKEMGIATVAVYSQADQESLHVALADEAICIGGPRAEDSYLNGERIISAAIATHAQAIHPGYGFLSENADFAALCKQYGVVFIGPSGEIISKMGDKDAARRLMKENNVPTTPGTDILKDAREAVEAAERIGYPCSSRPAPVAAARASAWLSGPRIWSGPLRPPPARRQRPLATAACTWKNT